MIILTLLKASTEQPCDTPTQVPQENSQAQQLAEVQQGIIELLPHFSKIYCDTNLLEASAGGFKQLEEVRQGIGKLLLYFQDPTNRS